MGQIKIIPARIGYSNSVLLLNGTRSVLIDTGVSGYFHQLETLFGQYNLKPGHIKLIVLTHTHNDHTGNLNELAKLTGAKVVVHKNEFGNLQNGFTPIPRGLSFRTRTISNFGKFIYSKYASPKPFLADLINNGEFSLTDFGIDGKIISTPGHTNGSQSVLLGKRLISGDTFINMKNGTIFPHFANNPKTLIKTWQYLIGLGIEEIYPGHGPKMAVEQVMPEFEHWKKKLLFD